MSTSPFSAAVSNTRLTTLLAACALATASPAWAQTDAASAPVTASTQPVALQVGASTTTSTGLVIKLLRQGKGASPSATDTVKVHYRGTFPDGKEFDSSYSRGAPLEFPLNRVIKCWTEGVQRLQIGAKAQLICPPAIAYGPKGAGGGAIPPNATLHFEVELLGITPSR
jgi:FKBP-type peptidyl-prolyl cis-trans isomerase FkpA